jgi:hypothetical protein
MTDDREAGAPPARVDITASRSRQFAAWLAGQRVSLAFATYQAAKMFLMGLAAAGDGLWLCTL